MFTTTGGGYCIHARTHITGSNSHTYLIVPSHTGILEKMVQLSGSLTWELVKNHNSFMVKKNGRTRRSSAVRFSTERGNLMNLSTYKYSGIANSKTVDISAAEDGLALKKNTVKAGTTPNKGVAVIPLNKNFRRMAKAIQSQATDNFYRSDLKSAALARWTAVYNSSRRAKGLKKKVAVKKGRVNAKN